MKLQYLSMQVGLVLKLPILIILCFVILFYYLGWSFMSGIVVFGITFFCNA